MVCFCVAVLELAKSYKSPFPYRESYAAGAWLSGERLSEPYIVMVAEVAYLRPLACVDVIDEEFFVVIGDFEVAGWFGAAAAYV